MTTPGNRITTLLENYQLVFKLGSIPIQQWHSGEVSPICGHPMLDWKAEELVLVGLIPIGQLAALELWKDFERWQSVSHRGNYVEILQAVARGAEGDSR